MRHLRRLGSKIPVRIGPDDKGFTGRECPEEDCEGYFKIVSGTGLQGEGLPCHCPYCGHMSSQDEFWTKEQIEYARSVALRRVADAIHMDLKSLEFEQKPQGMFGIGVSMKVKRGTLPHVHQYREKELETEVICATCTLRYAVYGVFAFCPDCGQHNSLQILEENFKITEKMLGLAAGMEAEIQEKLLENALEDCVSAFDGFGRELCRIHADGASNPTRAKRMSFQNLDDARTRIGDLFGIDFADSVNEETWMETVRLVQKRHLIAHKMGVVDEDYRRKSGDFAATEGRKVRIEASEVQELRLTMNKLARTLSEGFERRRTESLTRG